MNGKEKPDGAVIYVVGCNHGIQPGGLLSKLDGADMQEQREHFDALLEDIFRQGEIKFVGEEWGGGEETIAELLANRCNIPYRDINTSKADKQRIGIPCNYVSGPFTHEQKEHWHRQREHFMLERIQEYRGAARNLLVVCGFTHLERLSGLLQHEGAVHPIDYRELEWYRSSVFQEDP